MYKKNQESKKVWVIDFDGVVVSTMDILANYLSAEIKVSKNRALSVLFKAALENRPVRFKNLRKWGGKRYVNYLKNNFDNSNKINIASLLVTEMIDVITKLNGSKYLLTSNYFFAVEAVLKEKQDIFDGIIGFDKIRSKTEGLKLLIEKEKCNYTDLYCVTDTVGDIKEFLKLIPKENIYASTWGYHPICLLREVTLAENILYSPQELLER
jgi:HAD superfamily hydrolase (TIGR01549 family)